MGTLDSTAGYEEVWRLRVACSRPCRSATKQLEKESPGLNKEMGAFPFWKLAPWVFTKRAGRSVAPFFPWP